MAKRYKLPIEETVTGRRFLGFSEIIKGLELGEKESVMMYYTPDQPIATFYVFEDISEIGEWLASDASNRIGYMKSAQAEAMVNDAKIKSEAKSEESPLSSELGESSLLIETKLD